ADAVGDRPIMEGHYNGKIDAPRLFNRALEPEAAAALVRDEAAALKATGAVAVWDFSQEMTTPRVRDLSANRLDGQTVNLPARAMKGHNWTGAEMNWQRAPEQ